MTTPIDEQVWSLTVGPGATVYAVRYKGGQDDVQFNFENDASTIDLPLLLLWGTNGLLLDQAKRDICGYPAVTGAAGKQYLTRITPMVAHPFVQLANNRPYLFATRLSGTGWGVQGNVIDMSVQFPHYHMAKAEAHLESLTYDILTDAEMSGLGLTGAGTGVVLTATITTPGSYTTAPPNPAATTTSGSGSGCIVTGFYSGGLIPPLSGTLVQVFIPSGGSGYAPGDTLTLVGGSGTPAVLTVGTVGNTPDEATLGRYVTVEVQPGMEYLTFPQGGFQFVTTPNVGGNRPPVQGTAGKLTPNYDVTLTWEEIPVGAVGTVLFNTLLQNPPIDQCLGCVNNAPFPPAPAATVVQLMTANPAAAGIGYALGDILTLSGGTFTTAATVEVVALASAGSTGPVLAVQPVVRGLYTAGATPTNPVATTTTGAGTGCTLTCEFGVGLPQGTMLMVGATITPFRSTTGGRLYRLAYRFKYLPQGVQKLYYQGTLANQAGPTVNISGVTNTIDPTITTSAPHGLAVGNTVTIAGVVGATGVNGTFQVQTVPTNMTFTIISPAPGVYASGGTVGLAGPYRDAGYFEVTTNGFTNTGLSLYNSDPRKPPVNIYPWQNFAALFRVPS